MKSCDNCSFKLKEKTESKYIKHNLYCNKRKCVIPSADEAIWCQFWNKKKEIS